MRIPQNTIQQVLQGTNIVDVIGQYINLRVKGKNHWGLCPFHGEKTPSFSVNEDKQIFHCFGCHAGGNVFKFLMDYKRISYVEAIQELAAPLGITIRYDERSDEKENTELDDLLDLNEEVCNLFTSQLLDNPAHNFALEYLTKRNLKTATLRSFRLGYAPQNRQFLYDYLLKKPGAVDKALKIGMLGKNDRGQFYDRFAGRIIFPIFSTNGRVVAFAGRILEPQENTGKYVNSPESVIYSKSKVLYGLSHSKEEIRKAGVALVVEGYMDLISLHQNGVKNVIAVSGTALTDGQALLLSRYTKDVILLFDADTAGIKASMRSVDILLKQAINIRVASLPAGEDPDSFINKHSAEDFQHQMQKAVNFLEYQAEYYEKNGSFNDPMKSAEAIRELLRPVALIADEIKQSRLLTMLSEKFKLSERLLEDELGKIMGKVKAQSETINLPVRQAVQQPAEHMERVNKYEKYLIKALLEGEPEIISYVQKHIDLDEISDPKNRAVAQELFLLNEADEDVGLNTLVNVLEDSELIEYVTGLALDEYVTSPEWDKTYPAPDRQPRLQQMVTDVVKRFKIYNIDLSIKEYQTELKRTNDSSLQIHYMQIISELSELKKKLNGMFRNFNE